MSLDSEGKSKAHIWLKQLGSLPRRYTKIAFLTLKIKGRNLRWSIWRFYKLILASFALLIVALVVTLFYQEWNWIASHIIPTNTQIVSGLLVGVATVIAGVFVLLFSVSLFVIQNAAENYTPTILERFARDKLSILLYSFIGLSSLLIFCSVLLVESYSNYIPHLVVGSLVLLLITFGLAFWHYRRMADMVNPLRQIDNWRRQGLGYIRDVERNMDEMVEWLKLKESRGSIPDLKPEDYDGLSKAGSYVMQKSIHASLEKRIHQVYSITKRAATKRDYEVIEDGLAAVSNVLRTYLVARRDSTVPLPTEIPLSYSVDYDSLFDRSFQGLQEISRIGVSNADENLIRRVVDTVANIGLQSVKIVPKGDFPRSNPITDLSILYIVGIVEEASRHNYTDPCLSGVVGIRSIVQTALANKVPLVYEGAREHLKKIAFIGLAHRKSYIVDKVMETLGAISHQVIEAEHFHAERIVEDCLEDARKLTILSIRFIEEGGLQGSMNVTNYLGSFYDLSRKRAIPYITRHIPPQFIGKHYDDRDAMRAFHEFLGVNKLLWRFYRDIGGEVGKTESFMLFYIHEAIKENVKTVLSVLQDESWTFERKELESLISRHLSFYCVAFEAHQRITKNHYLDVVDFLGWLGILSVKNMWVTVADGCVQNIAGIAKDYVQKGDGFDYEAPRIFMKALYILMISNKSLFCKKVSDLAVDELKKFHSSYMAKLRTLDPSGRFSEELRTRLLVELGQLRRDFQEPFRERITLRQAKELLFTELEDSDFDTIESVVKPIVDSSNSIESKQTETTKDK